MRIVFELGEFVPLGEKKLKFSFIGSGNTFIIPQTGAFMPLKQIRAEYEQIQWYGSLELTKLTMIVK